MKRVFSSGVLNYLGPATDVSNEVRAFLFWGVPYLAVEITHDQSAPVLRKCSIPDDLSGRSTDQTLPEHSERH